MSKSNGGHEHYLVIRNKKALKVIPESLNLNFLQFFNILKNGDDLSQNKALYEKFKRKLATLQQNVTKEDLDQVLHLVEDGLAEPMTPQMLIFFKEWFSLPISKNYPKHLDTLDKKLNLLNDKNSNLYGRYRLMLDDLWLSLFANSFTKATEQFLRVLIKNTPIPEKNILCNFLFDNIHKPGKKEFLKIFLEFPTVLDYELLNSYFTYPKNPYIEELMRPMVMRRHKNTAYLLAAKVFSLPYTKDMKDFLKIIIETIEVNHLQMILRDVFSQPHTEDMEDLLKLVVKRADQAVLTYLAIHVLSKPHTAHMHAVLKLALEKADEQTVEFFAEYVLKTPHTQLWITLKKAAGIKNQARRIKFINDNLTKIESEANGESNSNQCDSRNPLVRCIVRACQAIFR